MENALPFDNPGNFAETSGSATHSRVQRFRVEANTGRDGKQQSLVKLL